MTFQPLQSYIGYEHVLNAAPCFVHPANGTLVITATATLSPGAIFIVPALAALRTG